MSELTRCNYCKLKSLKQNAKAKGMKVTKRSSNFWGGIDIYIHPKDIKIPPGYVHVADSEEGADQYFVMWCKEIGQFCEC